MLPMVVISCRISGDTPKKEQMERYLVSNPAFVDSMNQSISEVSEPETLVATTDSIGVLTLDSSWIFRLPEVGWPREPWPYPYPFEFPELFVIWTYDTLDLPDLWSGPQPDFVYETNELFLSFDFGPKTVTTAIQSKNEQSFGLRISILELENYPYITNQVVYSGQLKAHQHQYLFHHFSEYNISGRFQIDLTREGS